MAEKGYRGGDMLVIAGSGMGEYNFKNLNLDIGDFDVAVCDKNYKEDGKNILKLGYKDAKEYILKNYKKKNILYIVSGSPLFYSAGAIIAKSIPKEYLKIIDNTSSKSYLLSRLAIGEQDVESLSLHGRSNLDLELFLKRKFTLLLCDKKTPQRLQKALKFIDTDRLKFTIGYKLGYEDEIIKEINLDEIYEFDLDAPYVLLLKREFKTLPYTQDCDFEYERGMITKKPKREFALQNLQLLPNETLWDIGAGSGSCGIEAYKRYKTKVIFFEKNPTRIEHIRKNLSKHFVIDCDLIEGDASLKFEEVSQNPDKIFVGGGGEAVIKRLPYLFKRLNDTGIILINSVTLKHLSLAISVLEKSRIEYEVLSYSINLYEGSLKMSQPQRELFMIKIIKV